MKSDDLFAMSEAAVTEVAPVNRGLIITLASVELSIDGVVLELRVLRVLRTKDPAIGQGGTGVDLPRYRAPNGASKQAVTLPPEVREPLGSPVLERCVELGLATRVRP